MKIQFDKTGAVPIQPDFEMLRASLIGMQAVSPTALAEAAAFLPREHIDALIDLLASPEDDHAGALRSASFYPPIATREPDTHR